MLEYSTARARCQPTGEARVNNWSQNLQRWLFPPTCVLCGEPGRVPLLDLCRPCEEDLPPNSPCCQRCARTLEARPDSGSCGVCLREPPIFDTAFAPFRYAYPIDRMIVAFKFRRRLTYGRVLAELMAAAVELRDEPLPGCLIAVPLHRTRYLRRGFNQSLEIAHRLASRIGVPCDYRCCNRIRATVEQTRLDSKQRGRNLRGAFGCTRRPLSSHVAIIDDVMTSGSTVNELARELRRSGAKKIEVWTIARAS